MANITEILGTDSLSGSRTTINSNFTVINDEIADITALIDPVTSTITGIDSISAQQLTLSSVVGNLTTQLLQVDSSAAVFGVSSTFSQNVEFSRMVQKNGYIGSITAPSQAASPDLSGGNALITDQASITLGSGGDGQEVTIICKASGGTNILGTLSVASLTLDGINSSVTLKYFSGDGTWYIIGSHEITFSVNAPLGGGGGVSLPGA